MAELTCHHDPGDDERNDLLARLAARPAVPGDIARETSPRAVLARDRQMTLIFTLMSGLLGMSVSGFVSGFFASGLEFAGWLVFGLASGLVVSGIQMGWPSYMLTRGWLALRRQLPWSLMSFLADAHQRGVLRQAGAVYQFRHIELQHRLATRDK
jgi:hypothetical protein